MKRKTRSKIETGSYLVEILLELLVYVPRLMIRLCRSMFD